MDLLTVLLIILGAAGVFFLVSFIMDIVKHKDDLANLKKLVKTDSKLSEDKKKEVYFAIFKEDKEKGTNYVNYTHRSQEGKSCSYEDFKKFLKKPEIKYTPTENLENGSKVDVEITLNKDEAQKKGLKVSGTFKRTLTVTGLSEEKIKVYKNLKYSIK